MSYIAPIVTAVLEITFKLQPSTKDSFSVVQKGPANHVVEYEFSCSINPQCEQGQPKTFTTNNPARAPKKKAKKRGSKSKKNTEAIAEMPEHFTSKPIWRTEGLADEVTVGIDLSQKRTVGDIISHLQHIERPFLTMKFKFSDEKEFKEFQRILEAINFQIKFHGSDIHANKECYRAFLIPINSSVEYGPGNLEGRVRLSKINSVDVDLCETAP